MSAQELKSCARWQMSGEEQKTEKYAMDMCPISGVFKMRSTDKKSLHLLNSSLRPSHCAFLKTGKKSWDKF